MRNSQGEIIAGCEIVDCGAIESLGVSTSCTTIFDRDLSYIVVR